MVDLQSGERAVSRTKMNDFVPWTQHVNLRTVRHSTRVRLDGWMQHESANATRANATLGVQIQPE